MITWNKAALPGLIASGIGTAICFGLWGWPAAAIFFVGGIVGSLRFN